jgi:hypothetical protein
LIESKTLDLNTPLSNKSALRTPGSKNTQKSVRIYTPGLNQSLKQIAEKIGKQKVNVPPMKSIFANRTPLRESYTHSTPNLSE